MLLPKRHGAVDNYRYGFQGQEKDDEIKGEGNSVNYKFRMHDPRLGRFFAVDPMFKEYLYYTPYQFSGNRVIDKVELEGLEPADYSLFYATKYGHQTGNKKLHQDIVKVQQMSGAGTIIGILLPIDLATGANVTRFLGLASSGMAVGDTYEGSLKTEEWIKAEEQGDFQRAEALKNEVGELSKSAIFEGLGALLGFGISKLGKLPKSSSFQYTAGEHSYTYSTDKLGRISRAQTDNLQFKTHNGRLPHDPNTPGKLANDDAGHLFADLFGGDPSLQNLVSQARNVNRSQFKTLENTWKRALNNGQRVEVDIQVNYGNNQLRPDSFDVTYKIDGEVFTTPTITNSNP